MGSSKIYISLSFMMTALIYSGVALGEDQPRMASESKVFRELFGDSAEVYPHALNLVKIISQDCDAYGERHVPIPTAQIASMCAFKEMFLQQQATRNYILSEPNSLLLPQGLGFESFRSGILNLNYDFNPTQVDGFSLYTMYTLRKSAMAVGLQDTLAVIRTWYGDRSSVFQNYYWPAISASVDGGLPLTQLLRAGLLLKCESEYFSCRHLHGLSAEQTLSAYFAIRSSIAEIKSGLEQFPDSELAQVQKFRAKLQLLKNVNARSQELDAAVAEANALFLRAPPARIARFFIDLENLEELSVVIDQIIKTTRTSEVLPTTPATPQFLLDDVFRRITSLKMELAI